jgi:hypothetical protein
VIGDRSPALAEARVLAGAGELRLIVMNGREREPLAAMDPADHAVVGASVPLFHLHDLLRRARATGPGAVTLLGDAPCPPCPRIGYRDRPWLAGIALLPGIEPPPPPWSAPLARIADLRTALAAPVPPPVRLAERPCPFPPRLQIQTTTACAAGCAWCPHPGPGAAPQQMDEGLFAELVDQCGAGGAAFVELYLHAEPLDDSRLPRLVARARLGCPGATLAVSTHEHAALSSRMERVKGGALDVVYVSVDPRDDRPLDGRLGPLAERARELADVGTALVATCLADLLPPGGRGRLRRACQALDLPLQSYRITCRAGDVVPAELGVSAAGPSPDPVCVRPFSKAYLRWDGALVGCCEDWRYQRVLGDARRRPLAELWNGEAYRGWRRALLAGRTPGPCGRCEFSGAVPVLRHGPDRGPGPARVVSEPATGPGSPGRAARVPSTGRAPRRPPRT